LSIECFEGKGIRTVKVHSWNELNSVVADSVEKTVSRSVHNEEGDTLRFKWSRVPVNIIVVGLFSVKVTEPLFAVGGWFTWVTMTDTETASDV